MRGGRTRVWAVCLACFSLLPAPLAGGAPSFPQAASEAGAGRADELFARVEGSAAGATAGDGEDGGWANVSALLHRNFQEWCSVDVKNTERRSYYMQFVEGVAGALNVSASKVRVLSVCTSIGGQCRSREDICPPEMHDEATIPQGAHGPGFHGDVSSSEEGEIDGDDMWVDANGERQDYSASMMASRMQVVFAVPSDYYDMLTDLLTQDTRLASRLEFILVETVPSNPNPVACSMSAQEHAAAPERPLLGLWPDSSASRALGSREDQSNQTADCPTGFRCSMRREMNLNVPLCKAEVGRFSPARRIAIIGPLYLLILLLSAATLVWIAGRRLLNFWINLKKTLWPGAGASKRRVAPPRYGAVSWEEYCEFYEAEFAEQGAAAEGSRSASQQAQAASRDVDQFPARSSFDTGTETEDVDVLLRQLDSALDRFRGLSDARAAKATPRQEATSRDNVSSTSGETSKVTRMARSGFPRKRHAAGSMGMVDAGAADSEEGRGETSSEDVGFIRASSTQTHTSVEANVSFPAGGSARLREKLCREQQQHAPQFHKPPICDQGPVADARPAAVGEGEGELARVDRSVSHAAATHLAAQGPVHIPAPPSLSHSLPSVSTPSQSGALALQAQLKSAEGEGEGEATRPPDHRVSHDADDAPGAGSPAGSASGAASVRGARGDAPRPARRKGKAKSKGDGK